MDGLTHLRHALLLARWDAERLARPWLRHLGWGAAAGLVLGAAALVVALLAVEATLRASSLEEQIAALRVAGADARRPATDVDYQTRLDAFYSYLPPSQQIPGAVERLLRLAEAKGLTLKTGEYRLEPDRAGAFAGYRITLPVVGRASAIQDFLLSALRQHKTLALEAVNFKRRRIESNTVEARVHFVLLTRTAAGAAAGAAR